MKEFCEVLVRGIEHITVSIRKTHCVEIMKATRISAKERRNLAWSPESTLMDVSDTEGRVFERKP